MAPHRSPPKQMAGLSWTAVTLSLLLCVGNCSVQIKRPDQNQFPGPSLKQLKDLVDEIWINYIPSYKLHNKDHFPMFSAAVSIPYDNNKEKYDVSGITDSAPDVKRTLLKCDVYKSTKMVAATLLKWPDVLNQCPKELVQWDDFPSKTAYRPIPWDQVEGVPEGFTRTDHAEYRALTAISTLTNLPNKNDLMLFYVLASPCVDKCTSGDHPMSILKSINEITKWTNYAVVFSNVFIAGGPQLDEKQRKEALLRLGTYKGVGGKSIGMNNIFRCDNNSCRRCYNSEKKEVTPFCYKDPSNDDPSTSFIEIRNDL
ncbi:uncharacterized protein [Clinocottus analis]|uniref:uncharacterized protein n=1 Tax=Clinocottus analis TaxID=304258 RepID=UPI0035C0E89A